MCHMCSGQRTWGEVHRRVLEINFRSLLPTEPNTPACAQPSFIFMSIWVVTWTMAYIWIRTWFLSCSVSGSLNISLLPAAPHSEANTIRNVPLALPPLLRWYTVSSCLAFNFMRWYHSEIIEESPFIIRSKERSPLLSLGVSRRILLHPQSVLSSDNTFQDVLWVPNTSTDTELSVCCIFQWFDFKR